MVHYYYEKLFLSGEGKFNDISLVQIGRLYSDSEYNGARHMHLNFYELTLITGGSGYIYAGNTKTKVKSGDIFLSFPHEYHEITGDKDNPLKFDFLAFDTDNLNFKKQLENITVNFPSASDRVFESEQVYRYVRSAIAEFTEENTLLKEEFLSSLFSAVVVLTVRHFNSISANEKAVGKNDVFLFKVSSFIDENLLKITSLTEIADALNYSYSYLTDRFKKITSQTLKQYFDSQKFEYAKFLLSANKPVNEVATAMNFSTQYAFSKAFKNHFGNPPEFYKNKKI